MYHIWVKPDMPRHLCLAVSLEEQMELGFDGRYVLIYLYSNKKCAGLKWLKLVCSGKIFIPCVR